MTPEEFLEKMKTIEAEDGGDTEVFHSKADKLLCQALHELGYSAGLSIYEAQERWYA